MKTKKTYKEIHDEIHAKTGQFLHAIVHEYSDVVDEDGDDCTEGVLIIALVGNAVKIACSIAIQKGVPRSRVSERVTAMMGTALQATMKDKVPQAIAFFDALEREH
jgi:hypothetical protein